MAMKTFPEYSVHFRGCVTLSPRQTPSTTTPQYSGTFPLQIRSGVSVPKYRLADGGWVLAQQ